MEFYFELLQLFYRLGENVVGIHYGGKFMLVAEVRITRSLQLNDFSNYFCSQNFTCS